MKLVNPTDTLLTLTFAKYVAQLTFDPTWGRVGWYGENGLRHFAGDNPDYIVNLNRLIPYFNDSFRVMITSGEDGGKWSITVAGSGRVSSASDISLNRAIMIALLRYHDVKVEITKTQEEQRATAEKLFFKKEPSRITKIREHVFDEKELVESMEEALEHAKSSHVEPSKPWPRVGTIERFTPTLPPPPWTGPSEPTFPPTEFVTESHVKSPEKILDGPVMVEEGIGLLDIIKRILGRPLSKEKTQMLLRIELASANELLDDLEAYYNETFTRGGEIDVDNNIADHVIKARNKVKKIQEELKKYDNSKVD